jgi:phenylalanine-4-hydroxylase
LKGVFLFTGKMIRLTMIIVTTEGIVEVWPVQNVSLDRVILASNDLETLEGVTASIRLQGRSENPQDVGTIDEYRQESNYWTMILDRNTFKLWLMFEADNYVKGYGKNEMALAARTPEIAKIIENLQKETGTNEEPV